MEVKRKFTGEVSNVAPLPSGRKYTPHELVHGLRSRDKQAAAAFYDQYGEQVHRLVRRFLGPDGDHHDVVNAAFVEILDSIGKLKEPQALTRWVSSITIHTVRGEIRRRKYRRLLFPTADPGAEQSMSVPGNQDILSRIYRMLKALGVDEQVIFVLHYLEGYTYDEIAELQGWSIATAKRRGASCKAAFAGRVHGDLVLCRFLEDLKDA